MAGYFQVAIAFGLLYGKVLLSLLSGVWVFAGAAQFLSVKLLQNHTLLAEIWLSVFFLNIRHIFYSLHFLSRYEHFPFLIKIYSIFSLTDETYAVLTHHKGNSPSDDAGLVWRVSLLNHATWIMGCLLGAFLKSIIVLKIKGLDFFLVGLFVVLLIEQLKRDKNWIALTIALGVGVFALNSGSSLWLFWAMAICVLCSLFIFQTEKEKA